MDEDKKQKLIVSDIDRALEASTRGQSALGIAVEVIQLKGKELGLSMMDINQVNVVGDRPRDKQDRSIYASPLCVFFRNEPCVIYENPWRTINRKQAVIAHFMDQNDPELANSLAEKKLPLLVVCATDEEIAQACAKVNEERRLEALKAKTEDLKTWLKEVWLGWEATDKQYPGNTYEDMHGIDIRDNRGRNYPKKIEQILKSGIADEYFLMHLKNTIAAAVRKQLLLPTEEERLRCFNEALAEYPEYKRLRSDEFYQQKLTTLKGIGFSEKLSGRILGNWRENRPWETEEAIEWAKHAYSKLPSSSALFYLLEGMDHKQIKKDKRETVFLSIGITPPKTTDSDTWWNILRVAKEIFEAGEIEPLLK